MEASALRTSVICLLATMLAGCCGVCKPSKSDLAPQFIAPTAPRDMSSNSAVECTATSGDITNLSPSKAVVGSLDFYLFVTGQSFTSDTTVQWNGSDRTTKMISATQVRAHILKTDVLTPGSYPVTTTTNGTRSNTLCFEVISPSTSLTKRVTPKNSEVAKGSTRDRSLVDPVTVGAIALLLSNALNRLQTVLENATGDAMAVGQSLEANGHAVLADLQGKLNYNFDQLKKEDRYLVNQAHELANEINTATNQLLIKATENAKQTMYNADILAYNATQSVPCQPHVGRIRYATTNKDGRLFKFIVGLDDDPAKVYVYGNWLDLTQPSVQVRTDEHPQNVSAPILGSDASSIIIQLPSDILTSVTKPDTLYITSAPGICTPRFLGSSTKPGPPETIAMDIVPRDVFDVDAVISPSAETGTDTWDWPQSFYRYGDSCDANFPVDHGFCLPDAVQTQFVIDNPWSLTVTTANCGSAVDAVEFDGPAASATCMIVRGHVKGCGTSWFGLNCNGHGWLGYNLNLHYLQYARRALQPKEAKVTVQAPPSPIVVTYDIPYPPDTRNVEWHYQVTIMLRHGPGDPHPTPIYLSDDVPNDVAHGFGSVFDEGTKTLTVTLPQNFKSYLEKD